MRTFFEEIFNSFTKRQKIILLGVSVVSLLVAVVLTVIWGFGQKPTSLESDSESVRSKVLSGQAPPVSIVPEEVADLKQFTVLLLGYGGAGHEGGMLTDVIQLVHFDLVKKQVTAISIPRDLWAKLPDGEFAKINATFGLGEKNDPIGTGGQLAKYMAGDVTGLEVNNFVSIDFVGFKRLIGEVFKGIEVEVTEPLVDEWYPITGAEQDTCGFTPKEVAEMSSNYSGFELERKFECRYEKLNFQPGVIKMQGGEAMKFVRSRHGSAGGDFSRSARQHQVLNGIFKKIVSIDGLSKLPELFKAANYTFSSDLSVGDVGLLAPVLIDLDSYTQKTLVLSTGNVFTNAKSPTGQFIVIPKAGKNNWQEVHSLVAETLQK